MRQGLEFASFPLTPSLSCRRGRASGRRGKIRTLRLPHHFPIAIARSESLGLILAKRGQAALEEAVPAADSQISGSAG